MTILRGKTAAIVGGGAVGRTCAFRLRQAGAEVVVFDPGRDPLPAWYGNAGHLCIEQPEPWANWSNIARAPVKLFAVGGPLDFIGRDIDWWLPWGLKFVGAASRFRQGTAALLPPLTRARPAWEALLAEIGRPDLLHGGGHFVVWDTDETAEDGYRRYAAAETGAADPHPAAPEEIQRLEHMLGRRIGGAIRFHNTAHVVGPGIVAEALDGVLDAQGVTRRAEYVRHMTVENEKIALHLSGGETMLPDLAVLCAGVWSRFLARGVGHKAPLIAERGYHVQTTDHDWPADMQPVLFEDRHVICTLFENGLRATSYSEFGRPDSPADPRKWRRLERWLEELRVPARGPFDEWMGSRPTFPDYLPAIGRSSHAPNLLYAFGHSHLGLTMSAVTAEYVLGLAQGLDVPETAPFSLDRFA
jgi:D-amino-acid dehydrogenase